MFNMQSHKEIFLFLVQNFPSCTLYLFATSFSNQTQFSKMKIQIQTKLIFIFNSKTKTRL